MRKPAEGAYRRGFPHGLMFHGFRAGVATPGRQGAIDPIQFEEVLRYVGVENILSPQEWLSRAEEGKLAENHLCLTFDDGLRSQVDVALPILDRHGLKAFWFVYSCVFKGQVVKSEVYSHVAGMQGEAGGLIDDFLQECPAELLASLGGTEFNDYVERMRTEAPFYSLRDLRFRFIRNQRAARDVVEQSMDALLERRGLVIAEIARDIWLTDTHLRDLSNDGHAVGLHSYDHPFDMSQLTVMEQGQQYLANFDHITTTTGKPPTSMSHPLNRYDTDTLRVLDELGIRCGFRSTTVPPSRRSVNPHRLEMAREDSSILLEMLGSVPQHSG